MAKADSAHGQKRWRRGAVWIRAEQKNPAEACPANGSGRDVSTHRVPVLAVSDLSGVQPPFGYPTLPGRGRADRKPAEPGFLSLRVAVNRIDPNTASGARPNRYQD